jgi:hypothetical protein
MVSVTAATLKGVMDLADAIISDTEMEGIIDLAVDVLNLYGAPDLANMSGTAGTKTLSLTSKEKAAVFLVARDIYYGFFEDKESVSVGGVSVTTSDVLSNAELKATIQLAAKKLQHADELAFNVGEDTSGIDYT